jgi:hypothetical protein
MISHNRRQPDVQQTHTRGRVVANSTGPIDDATIAQTTDAALDAR